MHKIICDIHNLLTILHNYCVSKSDNEDIECILSLLEVITQKTDILANLSLHIKDFTFRE